MLAFYSKPCVSTLRQDNWSSMSKVKEPLVLAALLGAIQHVLKLGITDLSLLHARVDKTGQIVQYKDGRTWVGVRVDDIDTIIRALHAQAKGKA